MIKKEDKKDKDKKTFIKKRVAKKSIRKTQKNNKLPQDKTKTINSLNKKNKEDFKIDKKNIKNQKPKMRGSRYSVNQRKRLIPSITHLRDEVVDDIKERKVAKDHVKVMLIGGVEEIGRNMIAVEYKDDIIIMDAGLEFPNNAHPGVDYIIPNVGYLKKYKHLIRGIVISHGHLDHVGALPYVIEDLGNPPIYTTSFTELFIKKRQAEFKHLPTPNIIEVKKGDRIKIGKDGMYLRFFGVEHAIPDSIGTIIETKFGDIIYPGDFKVARDKNNNPIEIEEYEEMGKRKPLLLLLESTNIEKPGFSGTDDDVASGLEKVFKTAEGRIIVATFSSQIERIVDIVKISENLGRKVAVMGFSLKTNLELAKELNIFTPKKGTLIDVKDVDNHPPSKVMIICTGGQGEEHSALARIAHKRDQKIKLQKTDTVVLSSSVVPGNERAVQALKDLLARQVSQIYHHGNALVHASGHAYRDEVAVLHKIIKPKFFIPIHGFYYNLVKHKELAMELGMPEKNIVVPSQNGAIVKVNDKKIEEDKESIPAHSVTVDGLGVGDVKEVVLRDRNMLSQDGIFVVFAVVDEETGKVKTSPDIISRGFIYLRESQELLREVRNMTRRTIEKNTKSKPVDIPFVVEQVREEIGKFLFQHTKRRPMVLPVIVKV